MWTGIILLAACAAFFVWLKSQSSGKPSVRSTTTVRSYPAGDADESNLPPFETVYDTLDLTFKDAKGVQRAGLFDIWGFGRGERSYVRGDLRDGPKSLRVMLADISRAVEPETGEIIADIQGRLATEFTFDASRVWDGALSGKAPLIRSLVYIAKLDGQFSAGERTVVVETIRALSGVPGATAKHAQKALAALPDTNLTVFRRLCGEINKASPELKQIAIAAAVELSAARKTPSAEQLQAVEYLKKRLESPTETGGE